MVLDLTRQLFMGLRVLAASSLALIAVAAHLLVTSGLATHRRARAHPDPTTREPTTGPRTDLGATTVEVVIIVLGLMGMAALLVAALYRVVNHYIGQLK